ncbi:hypothetical protein KFL_000210260 [Klebsormidium nitens]|uniref:Uncharacterized protein n=1 Tax=Klebsormidium nitens TaxID=105231 RepID=A0A1Y1HK44_KLENI|nr:hypothetical protein KFL_000210260 [Klebsormidium nitens]|eukprot:GAQ78940.1 hypothetical protein KFL_000210260 [Klebsormidium nitens]
MALAEEPTRSKVWSVFFRHAKFGMLMLNMGSKLVAVFVVLVIVGTTRDPGVDDATTQGASAGPTIRSRRELREYVPPATCPFDFSQTPFPMTLSLCSLPNAWSESCCAAIRNDFWIPAFGQNTESIPDTCIAAVEARLLQEQLEIKYSKVCGSDGVLSDPLLRRGQPGDNQMQTAPEDGSDSEFENVVSQLLYSEESLEEIPGDTRPLEERSVESTEETEEEVKVEAVRPNVLSRPWGWENGSDSTNDVEGQELTLTITVMDELRREMPVVSV